MESILWTALGFLSGSIPFSLIVARIAGGVDIRGVGDGNPGAANVAHSLGRGWGVVAMLLDFLKGAIPVGLAGFRFGIDGWQIVPVALAPVLGHMFSPFLGGRGGKALSTTFGTWSGLTLAAGPTALGLLFTLNYALWTVSGWAVMLAFLTFGLFVGVVYGADRPELLLVWLGNALLLAWKHRAELARRLELRPRWRGRAGRSS